MSANVIMFKIGDLIYKRKMYWEYDNEHAHRHDNEHFTQREIKQYGIIIDYFKTIYNSNFYKVLWLKFEFGNLSQSIESSVALNKSENIHNEYT